MNKLAERINILSKEIDKQSSDYQSLKKDALSSFGKVLSGASYFQYAMSELIREVSKYEGKSFEKLTDLFNEFILFNNIFYKKLKRELR
jgi:hypothetical protein